MRIHSKKRGKFLHLFLLCIAIFLSMNISTEDAAAKSVYLASEHHQSLFDAWNINPDGTVTKQATYTLQYSTDPAGIAIDNDSGTLFITSEFSGGVELVDPVTLTYLGVSSGPSDLAGIDVDDATDLVYSIRRSTNQLYIFQYDPIAKTISQIDLKYLPNCSGAFGLALDEFRSLLWVADTAGGVVRAYDTNTWTEDTAKSFTPIHNPVDVAIDSVRNLVYTVSIIGGASVPSGTGSPYISRYNVSSSSETTVDMGHAGVGIAVDEVTGSVYVTGGAYAGDNLTVWDTSTSPFTKLQDTGWIGNPAGLTIGNVSYNPLSLAKNDIIQGTGVYIGSIFTYEITFDSPSFNLTNVKITDDLPIELDFVSVTAGGLYDAAFHTVLWDLETIDAGQAVPTLYLDVKVNQNAQAGSTIYNYCTIEADQIPPTTVIDQDPTDPGDDPGVPVSDSELTLITPNGGETLNSGEEIAIRWSWANYTGNIRIHVYLNDEYYKTISSSEPIENGGDGILFSPPNNWLSSDKYKIGISTIDDVLSDFSDDYFGIVTNVMSPIRPVKKDISQDFESPSGAKYHNGVDYRNALGKPVLSVGNGIIHRYTKTDAGSFGAIKPPKNGDGPVVWVRYRLATGEPIYIIYGHTATSWDDNTVTEPKEDFKFDCAYSIKWSKDDKINADDTVGFTAPFYRNYISQVHLHFGIFKPDMAGKGTYYGPPKDGWGYSPKMTVDHGTWINPEDFFTKEEYYLSREID